MSGVFVDGSCRRGSAAVGCGSGVSRVCASGLTAVERGLGQLFVQCKETHFYL